ncbi:MAG: hypothetical protein ACRDS0_31100 [Pseudonocardiaceae bacterium]
MFEWAWVLLGYAVTYGALAGYVAVLVHRRVRVRRRAGRLR